MKTLILYKREHQTEIPKKFKEYDTSDFEEVIKLLIEEFSQLGDTVLDICAGLGKNLVIA